ncbi:MAG: hypothetical protein A3F04_01660 [Candidatus Chisholmbacteria bacterium RIFCSPHIGHO2_12_FULL_49_9]|uniref:Uncharacterized protein n=1 Tax=Candidatus Chisholmbacteria bacterium RIFCSPHIGHO2_01_FULL_52_32 TaxID=1797591 RepID=A0A1G1VSL3_9BACT|nr:MAG: hypothetical protein A3F04_01660 [Candidatus Chisholmbacteria bacterium RIFCSPHIGHO2_12_FULL_49_9]OGY18197.1 MAG: hypothetical protein A2786_01620 [Candidatus Chisholmbacteria bacterium RIFCSPHIGHO2_01_FULL_52_32]OGY20429.1 MAG: hypothetical protein A2900_05120 [Candidatus Chisholmbacteria bacterium RIFCSPLOWO2_01_FULL_50_28]
MSEKSLLRSEVGQGRAVPERKELPGTVVAVACMDEALGYSPGILVAGVGGSAVTAYETGNQTFFPDQKRRLVERVRPVLYHSLGKMADQLGLGFGVTSHVGCGWAGVQGIESISIPRLTQAMSFGLGREYFGHIPFAKEPSALDKPGVAAYTKRSASDHYHNAESIVLTVGGFISQNEIDRIASRHGRPFILSADWLNDVVISGGDIHEALDFLEVEINIARGIAEGVVKPGAFQIFDGQRLDTMTTVRNRAFVHRLLQRFTRA